MNNNKSKGCIWIIASVCIFLWAIVNPISLVISSAIGVGILLVTKKIKKDKKNKKAQEIENEKNKEIQELEDKRNKILNNDKYDYIKNFVEKYGHYGYTDEDFFKLMKLLTVKGVEVSKSELEWILKKELEEKNYRYFKEKIHSCSPEKLEDYIHSFLDAFGKNNEYIYFLERLLKDDNIQFDKNTLNAKMSEVIERIELERFEKKISNSDYDNEFSIDKLDSITGYEFEYFLKNLFKKMGYEVKNTSLSNDQGADLIVSKFGDRVSVQAKRYSGGVGNKAIQEVVASIKHYKVDRGVVITTSYFTQQAINLAKSNNVELINRQELKNLIDKFY